MKTIANKTVITLTPKRRFIDWVRSTDAQAGLIDEAAIHEASTAYLVDCHEDGEEPESLLRKNCKVIFEQELEAWYTDMSAWPEKRDFKTFRQWFEAKVCDVIVDIGKKQAIFDEY